MPKFTILWGQLEVGWNLTSLFSINMAISETMGQLEEILLLKKFFFPIVDTCLGCEDIARQSCMMVSRWRLFGDFLRPAFSASRVQHVSDLHSKFALRPHHVLQLLRLGKERKKKKPQGKNLMVCPIP